MSTAAPVPETYELDTEDATETLRRFGRARLVKDAFLRFRAADGFSHARALAFQIVLTAIPGVIALVGLASALGQESFRRLVEKTLVALAPGPAGKVLTQALSQGKGGGAALWVGLFAALIAGTTAMGQLERGANRIYGIERDRPAVRKYTTGLLLACTAGLLGVLAFVLFVAGDAVRTAGSATGWDDALVSAWSFARWPLGAGLIVASFALLFKRSPRRNQPGASWLVLGAGVAMSLWVLFTVLLTLYLTASKSFGQTYGPLAGVIGILLWAFLTSLAIFLGLAFAAQLEAVRAGVLEPQRDPSEVPRRGAVIS
jgi:YihY family inner membrane protein